MNTHHTPGPWQEMGCGTLLHPVTGRPLTTRRIETSLGFIEIHDETNEPDANFRLLLSAPALLEALQNLVRVIERDNLHTTAGLSIVAAKAAIAQATPDAGKGAGK